MVAALRTTVLENKAIWDAKAGELKAIEEKADKLLAVGHRGSIGLAGSLAKIGQAVAEQRWADATVRLDAAVKDVEEDWADYEVQIEAQALFEARNGLPQTTKRCRSTSTREI